MDTHTHILLQGDITAADYDEQLLKQSPEYRTILATVNARRALEYGFTSIRDLETEDAGYADADVTLLRGTRQTVRFSPTPEWAETPPRGLRFVAPM